MSSVFVKKEVKDLSVLMIGAGGLGAPALMQLAQEGVKTLGIIDSDRVEMSNLHRQILYREGDIGKPKAQVAAERLNERFPQLDIKYHVQRFTTKSADTVLDYDLILDGTDQFETKMLISDLCTDANRAYVFAGVVGSEGQVMAVLPNQSACLRCLFDEVPPPGSTPRCETLGVIGPIAGMVAAEQVKRGLELFSEPDKCVNRLWAYDGLRAKERVIALPRMEDCRGCGSRKHLRGWMSDTPAEGSADAMNNSAVETLSVVSLVCPQTFVRTKRALDALGEGEKLWVLIGSDESARNVPVSAIAAGYKLLVQSFDGESHRLLFEKPIGGAN